MFDSLFEKIQRSDEIESKLLSIFEGKTWEQISLLRHLSQAQFVTEGKTKVGDKIEVLRGKHEGKTGKVLGKDTAANTVEVALEGEEGEGRIIILDYVAFRKLDECVCHIYGLSDEKLVEFYRSMGNDWNAFNEPYGSDKTEVEEEIKKRGLEIPVNEKVFYHVTNVDNIDSIEGDGLKTNSYITDRFEDAEAMRDIMADEHEIQADILRFNLTPEQVNKLTVDQAQPNAYETHEILRPFIESKLDENLTDHARRELELAGMFDKEVDGSEAAGGWNRLCAEAVIELMEVFAEQGHSGFSASMTQDLFSRLSKFEALTDLTDNPDEWNDISEMQSGEPGWQSSRNPSCFSEDGGKTYWDINEEYYLREDEEDGMVYSGGLSTEEWNNRPMHQSKHFEKKE